MSGEIELVTERRVDGGGLACIDVRPLIHEIHDVQVMLDYDLAKLYGVETKQLKRQVRRNIRRFPQEFMFELSENEMKSLRCQFGASNRGGDRYGAYAFSEQGIAMLSAVLRSATAIETSIRIINAFIEMRRTLASLAPSLVTLSARLEASERRQITDQSRNEARFDQIFAKMSEGELPQHQIFFQGKFWDAKSLLIKFIRRAKSELVIVDIQLVPR